jgi:hypothetical protein
MDPARMFKESLTSPPELENSQGQKQTSRGGSTTSASAPKADIDQSARDVRLVPIVLKKSSVARLDVR